MLLQLVQFSSFPQLCLTLCNPMDCSTPVFSVHYQLLELAQTHVHWVSDDIQPSHPLSSSSPPAFNLSQHQGFFQWVSSLHQVAKVLEFQLQHQSFQWIFSTDFLQDVPVWTSSSSFFFFFKFYFIFKLYKAALVLPNIKMNPPQVYMCSPSQGTLKSLL